MGSDISAVKKVLRQQIREALAELTDQERDWSDRELTQQFLQHPVLKDANTVMVYYGVGTEIRTEGLITAFRDAPWPGVQYISGGIYGLSAKALAVLHECMTTNVNRMRDFQRALLSAGLKLRAYPMGKIIDVDHASDIDTARRFIAQA